MATALRRFFLKTHVQNYSTKCKRTPRKPGPTFHATAASLAGKGFLRPQKEYTPPADLKSQLETIYTEVLGSTDENIHLKNFEKRFELFHACENKLQHKIPNSLLHTIEIVADVTKYYETAVDTVTPFDQLKNIELPKNLHIQYEYHRFHPETDTKFGGVTAFPGSSTLVTGLKYKDKYKGHNQKLQYPHII